MTVQEFTDLAPTLECLQCHRQGLKTDLNVNNNGLLVVCPHCTSKRPLGSLLYLRQDKNAKKVRRQDYPPDQGLFDVWERFGHRCTVCCLTEAQLRLLGLGLSRHHVTDDFKHSGHDCQIVPICTGCKTLVDHRQRESLRWYRRLQELREQSVPSGRPGLPSTGLSPDSVRPSRQTPVGVVEGFSDDDADA